MQADRCTTSRTGDPVFFSIHQHCGSAVIVQPYSKCNTSNCYVSHVFKIIPVTQKCF